MAQPFIALLSIQRTKYVHGCLLCQTAAPDLTFDDDVVKSRAEWYERCLAHPAIQDKLVVEHLIVDERQKEVGALLKTQAIERATGEVLLELKMNALYHLKIDADKDVKITKVKVFLEMTRARPQSWSTYIL